MTKNSKNSKTSKVVGYMLTHTGITSMQAFELCKATRLSAIIWNLKQKGYEIETLMHDGEDCRYAEYRFTPEFKKELKQRKGK